MMIFYLKSEHQKRFLSYKKQRLYGIMTGILVITFFSSIYATNVTNDSLLRIWESREINDSIKFEAIQSIIGNYTYSDPRKSLYYSDIALDYFKGSKNKRYVPVLHDYKGTSYAILGVSDSSKMEFEKALSLFSLQNDTTGMASANVNLGNYHSRKYEFNVAINHFYTALDYYEIIQDTSKLFVLNNNLAQVFSRMKDWASALTYLNKALSKFTEKDNTREYAQLIVNKGRVLGELGRFSEAEIHIKEGIEIHRTNNNIPYLGYSYRRLAEVYYDMGNQQSTLKSIDASIDHMTDADFQLGIVQGKALKAKFLYDLDFKQSMSIAESLIPFLEEHNPDEPYVCDLYFVLYKGYKRLGNVAASLKMLEKHKLLNDKTLQEDLRLAISRQVVQREFDRKMLLKQYEFEKRQAEIEFENFQEKRLILVGGFFLLFAILFIAAVRFYRDAKQRNKLLLEVERLRNDVNPKLSVGNQALLRDGLNRAALESYINKPLNETDWKVLNILLKKPEIHNKEIAEQIYLSVEGVSSSLRRMYKNFNIDQSKYKKIALIMKAMEISSKQSS